MEPSPWVIPKWASSYPHQLLTCPLRYLLALSFFGLGVRSERIGLDLILGAPLLYFVLRSNPWRCWGGRWETCTGLWGLSCLQDPLRADF